MKSSDGRFEFLDLGYKHVPDGSPREAVARFGFNCPRGKGDDDGRGMCSGLLIVGAELGSGQKVTRGTDGAGSGSPSGAAMWDWDGVVETPTFGPSINCSRCGWHGHIIAGQFKDA